MMATYNAPEGDETQVVMFGIEFADGVPVEVHDDFAKAKLRFHPLFDVFDGIETEPGVEIMAPRKRGRPPKNKVVWE